MGPCRKGRLAKKASESYGHPFSIADLENLPKAINSPVAVFYYGDKAKAVNVITDILVNGKNILVGIAINPEVKGSRLGINSVRTVFPKDVSEWENWARQGIVFGWEKVETADNTRNPGDVTTASTHNIVKNFANGK